MSQATATAADPVGDSSSERIGLPAAGSDFALCCVL